MNRKKRLIIFIRVCLATALPLFSNGPLAAPVPVQTSTLDKALQTESKYGIGFTSSITQRPFVGVAPQDTTLIYLKFRYKDFYVEGLDVGYTLFNTDDVTVDLLATPRFYEVEPAFAEGGELDGIDTTRRTYFAGISTQYRTKPATLTFQVLTDLFESDGIEIVATASKAFRPGAKFILAPTVGITYQDSELVDHFYGVQPNEVTIGRPAYGGHSSTNFNVLLTGVWDVHKHVRLLSQIKYEVLGSGITNSPIVDEDSISSILVGFVYLF